MAPPLTSKYRTEDGRYYYPGLRRRQAQRLRLAALAAYTNGALVCAGCGFSNPDALTLDHIENDGAEWRKVHKVTGGQNTYNKLRQLGYPEGFQVLCMNCNWLKEVKRRLK